jgi:hypothetical protein
MELLRADNFVVRWYDAEHTILVVDILERWTWDDAYEVINCLTAALEASERDVYTIFHFTRRGLMMPRSYALPNIRKFLVESPNEKLIIFINSGGLLKSLLEILHRTFDVKVIFNKFRFVASMEAALAAIAEHKSNAARV